MNLSLNSSDFHDIKRIYKETDSWGILTSIDLHKCNPEKIRSKEVIRDYIIKLCDLIEMKRFGEPQIVHFGEDQNVAGFSMTQLIETSLISGHFANLTNHSYIDIFSCKVYSPTSAAEFTKSFFEAEHYNTNILFRK